VPLDILKPDWGLADRNSVRKTGSTVALVAALAVYAAAAEETPLARDDGNTPSANYATLTPTTSSALPAADGAIRMATYSVYPAYTIRRTAPEVRLQFSVADERGQLVTNLTASDFRIFDNQSAVHQIRQFSHLEDLPLQLGLLLDVSDSVQKAVSHEKLATQYFVQNVLRPETDRAFLMAFGRDVRLWQPSTAEPTKLSQALQGIQQLGYATNLYDGLFAACFRQFPLAETPGLAQRVVVLFSDGEDTGSLHSMTDVITLAQRNEIQIYAISVHARQKLSPGDAVLQRLAGETGGQFFVAGADQEFPAIFAEMEQQMRTQYYVSFRPEHETPGFHALRLEMTGPQKLHVRARQGYYFEAP
jgi:VWFA-related protein